MSKTILITGATSGIGLEMAKSMAKLDQSNKIIIIGRNLEKTQKAIKEIQVFSENTNIDFLLADLSLMQEVLTVVKEFKSKYSILDVLINNAGVYLPNKILTTEGLELTVATNYFSPFYLSNLLLDNLKLSEAGKIINVSSGAYSSGQINFNNFNSQESFNGGQNYCNSKLAINFFTQELAKRLKNTKVAVNAFNPGKVATNLNRHLQFIPSTDFTAIDAAENGIWLASNSSLNKISGKYFYLKQIQELNLNANLQTELWNFTEETLNKKLKLETR